MTQGDIEQELAHTAAHARSVLQTLPVGSRHTAAVLFAVSACHRLFRWYDAVPTAERRPYPEVWRPVVDDVWAHLAGDGDAYRRISQALARFYASPYSNDGRDGPDDIDQDEAAAALCTANCVVHGLVDFALWSAARVTDRLDTLWFGIDEPRRVAEISAELQRQRRDLHAIAAAAQASAFSVTGVPAQLLAALRAP